MSVPKRLYSPTGKPRDRAVATHSREIRQMETAIRRVLVEQETAIAAVQDGVDGLDGGVPVLDRVGLLDHASSTTRTAVYSFQVPANTLDTGNILRLTLDGEVLQNSGGSREMRIDVSWGGTIIWDGALTSFAASATLKPMKIRVDLAVASASAQYMNGHIDMTDATATTVGYGDLGAGNNLQLNSSIASASLAEDITTPLTLAVFFTFNFSHADFRYTRRAGTLELV